MTGTDALTVCDLDALTVPDVLGLIVPEAEMLLEIAGA